MALTSCEMCAIGFGLLIMMSSMFTSQHQGRTSLRTLH